MLYSKPTCVGFLQTTGQTITGLFYSTRPVEAQGGSVFDRIGTLVGLCVVICLHVVSYTVNKAISHRLELLLRSVTL